MKTIRFTDETKQEEGCRIIMLNGLVQFMGDKRYRIPNYVADLLDEQNIPYEVVDNFNFGTKFPKIENTQSA